MHLPIRSYYVNMLIVIHARIKFLTSSKRAMQSRKKHYDMHAYMRIYMLSYNIYIIDWPHLVTIGWYVYFSKWLTWTFSDWLACTATCQTGQPDKRLLYSAGFPTKSVVWLSPTYRTSTTFELNFTYFSRSKCTA